MNTPRELRSFLQRHGLRHWAPHVGEHRLPGASPDAGFHVVALLPPLSVQRKERTLLLEAMTRPLDKPRP